ncbi:hypothetical protein Tco_1483715 [Tanacetum coccineum]
MPPNSSRLPSSVQPREYTLSASGCACSRIGNNGWCPYEEVKDSWIGAVALSLSHGLAPSTGGRTTVEIKRMVVVGGGDASSSS